MMNFAPRNRGGRIGVARRIGQGKRRSETPEGMGRKGTKAMEELTTADDPVFLSWLTCRLKGEGIPHLVLDFHTGAAFGGALSALSARVMVEERDLFRARRLLESQTP
jgi:hypothetical protein